MRVRVGAVLLRGIIPILFIPFRPDGGIDETGLRRIACFEREGGVHGLGINGFASEAYKLNEEERWRAAQIVADEIGGAIPLIIGIAPNSTRQAIAEAKRYAALEPTVLMALPPHTMSYGTKSIQEHFLTLADQSPIPIMLQQAPQIPAYRHCALSAEELAELAHAANNLRHFKIEGPGSATVIRELKQRLHEGDSTATAYGFFGGGGGITVLDEWRAGADGLIPGVGFNDAFLSAWEDWQNGDTEASVATLQRIQPLIDAVSGAGHEHSVWLRKLIMRDAGYIDHAALRTPVAPALPRDQWQPLDLQQDPTELYALIRSLDLRVARNSAIELE